MNPDALDIMRAAARDAVLRACTDRPPVHSPAHEAVFMAMMDIRTAAADLAADPEHGLACQCQPCRDVRCLSHMAEQVSSPFADEIKRSAEMWQREELFELHVERLAAKGKLKKKRMARIWG